MTNNRKKIAVKWEELAQLRIYIQQVQEAAKIVRSKHKHKSKLNDFINVLVIHTSVLEKYFNHLIELYDVKDLPNLGE